MTSEGGGSRRIPPRWLLLLAVILGLLATPAPSTAANGWWTFNRHTNINSTLRWKWTNPPNPTEYTGRWRAGSGTTMHECEKGKGWLPLGWYSLKGHWRDYNGSRIKGRVWWVQDKTCRKGTTTRTELFIHTEETRSRGQSCTSAYDDRFCWEREADYLSAGCIKLARPSPVANFENHIYRAHQKYHDHGGSPTHGDFKDDANELYVYT